MSELKDWSTIHKAAGRQLFDQPQSAEEWMRLKLSPGLVEEFWKDGYISNIPILTPEQCDKILEEYKYFTDPSYKHPGMSLLYEYHRNQTDDPQNVLMHCLGHWRMTELFHDLVFHPKVLAAGSQLLVQGEEKPLRFWHDQLFAKPPLHGGNVAWHQDYSYWTRTSPCMHLTVHIALDEQTEENGCIQYIKGSHRWTRDGKPLPITSLNFKDMDSIKTVLNEEEAKAFKPVACPLKKGHASFHHSMVVHGSFQNRSEKPRRAAVLNYFADGVRFSPDGDNDSGHTLWSPKAEGEKLPEHMKPGIIQPGAKMEGQLFPLVYDPIWTT